MRKYPRKRRGEIAATPAVYSARIYLAPFGKWAWRISDGESDAYGGVGYDSKEDACNHCLETLDRVHPGANLHVEDMHEPNSKGG